MCLLLDDEFTLLSYSEHILYEASSEDRIFSHTILMKTMLCDGTEKMCTEMCSCSCTAERRPRRLCGERVSLLPPFLFIPSYVRRSHIRSQLAACVMSVVFLLIFLPVHVSA